ncbi:24243_t:CDS:10 [Cetraspora pellucida]|uniref:Glutathione synthetase n=1 Tax=Cetraspora pellucida TaxID=1433469 RepID=A0A9N9ESU1_9GLOM|nr:24243_t:CDS:10 [Cetraspora pellucida]
MQNIGYLEISPTSLEFLKEQAIDWALSHGLIIRSNSNFSSTVVHAPISLFPSPFPKKEFELALELQPIFNLLFHKLSRDHELIEKVVGELINVDDFIQKLYNIYLTVRKEGITQQISLGLHRSDYILHMTPNSTDAHIQQVEFNTISSSFSSLSTLTSELHKYLLESTKYFDVSPALKIDALPTNEAMTNLPRGIAKAHQLYGSKNTAVLMVVQPAERNAFDQRWIEYILMNNYKIHLIRKTLFEIQRDGKLDKDTKTLIIDNKEICVVYFRSGYGPNDYPTEKEWDARLLIERSKAIKCPTVAYQLVGAKKIQQVLAIPGVLEKYISNPSDITKLRSCFTGLYPLDSSPEGEAAAKLALEHPERFVMKPQREGGGNNIYTKDIPQLLRRITPLERSSYILMDLIQPPMMKNIVIREGKVIQGEMISELGIYGVFIGSNNGDEDVVINEIGGHLLRTKGKETNEGGVATGYSVIDSPLLI